MREILFKAKRTDTKEWVEGYPFPPEPGGELNRMIVFEDLPGGSTMTVVEIDPETLCEFTGLTDKNGVKIFEGDKVADERGKIAVVKFGDFNCGCCYDVFGYFLDGDFEEFHYCSGKGPDECYLTVVGNIHDEVTP